MLYLLFFFLLCHTCDNVTVTQDNVILKVECDAMEQCNELMPEKSLC